MKIIVSMIKSAYSHSKEDKVIILYNEVEPSGDKKSSISAEML